MPDSYTTILWICILFNGAALTAIWVELRGQRKRGHDLRDKLETMYAGVMNVLFDHERRIASFEKEGFQPQRMMDVMSKGVPEIKVEITLEGK